MDSHENTSRPQLGFLIAAAVGSVAILVGCFYLLATRRDLAAVLSLGANLGVLLVAVLALWFTGAQLSQARRSNELTAKAQRASAEQTERDSRAAVRPYVYASLVPGLWGATACDLQIQNFGKTPARELLIDADSWPESSDEHVLKLKRFCETPHTLPPGASHRLLWHDSRTWGDGKPLGQHEVVDITLSYSDDNGDSWTEAYRCDVPLLMQVEPSPTEGPTSVGSGHEKLLKDIGHALRTLNFHVGSLRR